jgi:hypothetical protein
MCFFTAEILLWLKPFHLGAASILILLSDAQMYAFEFVSSLMYPESDLLRESFICTFQALVSSSLA